MNVNQMAMQIHNYTLKQTMNIEAQQTQEIIKSANQIQQAVNQNIVQNGHVDVKI